MLLALALGLATNLWRTGTPTDDGAQAGQRARSRRNIGAPAYATVQDLAGRAGLPMPRVYLMNEAQPNALRPDAARNTLRLRNDRHPATADRGELRGVGPRTRARAKPRHIDVHHYCVDPGDLDAGALRHVFGRSDEPSQSDT